MPDAPVTISVRNLSRRKVNLRADVDEDGYVVVVPPPPGSFAIDPEHDMGELVNTLTLLADVGKRKRQRRKGKQP